MEVGAAPAYNQAMRSLSIYFRARWFESRARWHERQALRHQRWLIEVGTPAAQRLAHDLHPRG